MTIFRNNPGFKRERWFDKKSLVSVLPQYQNNSGRYHSGVEYDIARIVDEFGLK